MTLLKPYDLSRPMKTRQRQIAALFVHTGGAYFDLPYVDPWDRERDARLYRGPYPVIAHPPCERWGRYWGGGPLLHGTSKQKKLGDDGGCFDAALNTVRNFGGVLEHPEASHAWAHFGLNKPPRNGGWIEADTFGGWTCCVEQGHYGHSARKATWLYAVRCKLPDLIWGKAEGKWRLDEGFHSNEKRRLWRAAGIQPIKRLTALERISTPHAFRDVLIAMARSVRR